MNAWRVLAEKALAEELRRLAATPPGNRNHTLYAATKRLFEGPLSRLVEDGPNRIATGLHNAALKAGLPDEEIRRTMASAFTGTTAHAATLPADERLGLLLASPFLDEQWRAAVAAGEVLADV